MILSHSSPYKRSVFFLFCILLIALQAWAQQDPAPVDVKTTYQKTEVQVPMRDGVKLFVSIYTPRDTSKRYPILMTRTPYSAAPYGPDAYRRSVGPSQALAREGYIFAYCDVRGRWMSEGEFSNMRPMLKEASKSPQQIDESTDTYDTIEWLLKNAQPNNGRVGIWGISYPGFYAAAATVRAHPALKAVSPQAPIADWFIGDDMHHNGAYFLLDDFSFFSGFGQPRPKPTTQGPARFEFGMNDAYRFFLDMGPLPNVDKKYFHGEIAFWEDQLQHPNYDEFWQSRNLLPHLKDVTPAVMVVGGLFDAEDLYGPTHIYQQIKKTSSNTRESFVFGPWCHGCWASPTYNALADINFGPSPSKFFQEQIEARFFNYHLKDQGPGDLPQVYAFRTGLNEWKKYDAWPPANAQTKSLYLHAGGKLGFDKSSSGNAYEEFVSDPAHPVPYTSRVSMGRGVTYMIEDQRFAERRPDVLTYTGDPLQQDMTVVGPIKANLFVSTTGTDADWVVKLIDVFPNDTPENGSEATATQRGTRTPSFPPGTMPAPPLAGYEMLVRADVMRSRFRKSYEEPEPLTPNQVTPVSYTLWDVHHTFKKGHRIMVQIQSSWFPLVDRNPQKFVNIYTAQESDFQKATHRVYHTDESPTNLEMMVLPE
jgi:putative CocE/NonD family hydrolase